MNILFDTNILLDVYLKREEFFEESAFLIAQVELENITGWIGSTTVTTIHYLVTKWKNVETAKTVVGSSLKLFNISPVNRVVLEEALELEFSDFEDAVLHQSAIHANLDGIVTRNKKDFSKASLPIYTPKELIAVL
ncbi:MAG: type II toxin-antitoxin system VapC family toxin [Balneola sp.]